MWKKYKMKQQKGKYAEGVQLEKKIEKKTWDHYKNREKELEI